MDSLPYHKSPYLEAHGFIHGFFGRQGGRSTGVFGSLNCAYNKGDLPENVAHNRQCVTRSLISPTFDPILLVPRQIHSARVLVDPLSTDAEHATVGDAVISTTADVFVGVLTADCVPVLIASPKTRTVAALHAGWRGAVSGIVQNTIDSFIKLGHRPDELIAAIGPCIWQPSFEVGEDVRTQVPHSMYFRNSERSGYYYFDLPGFVMDTLRESGIQFLTPSPANTYTDAQSFFSYRRTTHSAEQQFGCQVSVIYGGYG